MPIEIKELVLRAVVEERAVVEDAAQAEAHRDVASPDAAGRDALVEECVREVLRILQRAQDR